MSVKLEFKTSTSQNFRQIIDVKNLNLCAIVDNVNNFPHFVNYLVFFNETLAGGVHKCPYTTFYFTNVSHFSASDMKNKYGQEVLEYPDGLARR